MKSSSPEAAWLEMGGERVAVQSGLTLGRSRTNGMVLPDDRVSRRHAVINAQNGHELWLVDFGSSNGTYLNGRRVVRPMPLRDGDRILINPFQLVFRAPGQAGAGGTGAELTQMTVVEVHPFTAWLLLIDMVGSSKLMQELPPEEMAVLIGSWIARCREVLEETGGFIDKYLGDGFLAFWDAQRTTPAAVRTSLEKLRALQAEERPAFRMIMHHGRVARGSEAAPPESERTFGRDVHFIFRLESASKALKEPRVMSAAAATALGPGLRLTSLGTQEVANFPGGHELHAW
jgi:pSer/pThr/pTyr-binding forkhead associated (FHA) protein